jgi:hypothetical protein
VDLITRARQWSRAAGSHPLVMRVAQLTRNRAFRNLVRGVIVFLALAFLAYGLRANWDELEKYQWTVDYDYLALAIAAYGLCFALVLLVWHRVMVSVGAMADLWVNARIFCYSSLPKRIPGVVWYVASRMHLYKDEGVARSLTLLGTALETALFIVSGFVVYLLSLLFPLSAKSAVHLPPGTVFLLLVPLLIVLHPAFFNKVFGYLLKRLRYNEKLSLTLGQSVGLLLICSLAWVLGGVDLYLLANAIYPVPVAILPAVIGAWAASGAVSFLASFLIQGMGVTEITLSLLLSSYLPLPVSIVIAISFRILLTAGEVGWALLILGAHWGLRGLREKMRASRTLPPDRSEE